ncbi:MAG: protein kinase [Myxococcales bacterium]|nr:protein kinase [Myxococcales bacterium]
MPAGDLAGAVLDGRYKVIEAVAQGAMGVVYRAERLKLGKIVAVKVLHDELPNELSSRKRFELEAMAMAKLEHPHCAAVLDVGTHDGKPYVVMDFITGEDLKSLIDKGPVPPARAVEIVRQVLSGVAHAHEHGIIHRDIKPANVLLSQKAGLGDHVKILDFGLARLQQEQTTKLTSGIVVGTPAYMAPEQIRGTQIDGRCDLYACGVLLFELLTGHKPFHSERDDPMEVVSMHLKNPPPTLADKLPGVDFGELEGVVAKALQKTAADRFQTATEFVAALDAAESAKVEQVSASMMIPQGGTQLGVPVVAAAAAHSAPHSGPVPAPSLSIPQQAASVPSAPVPQPYGAELPTVPSGQHAAPEPPKASAPFPAFSEHTEGGQPIAMRPNRPANPDGLPFSRKQLAIGGGAVLLLIIIIAAVAGGGRGSSAKSTASDDAAAAGSGEIEMQPTSAEGADKVLARAGPRRRRRARGRDRPAPEVARRVSRQRRHPLPRRQALLREAVVDRRAQALPRRRADRSALPDRPRADQDRAEGLHHDALVQRRARGVPAQRHRPGGPGLPRGDRARPSERDHPGAREVRGRPLPLSGPDRGAAEHDTRGKLPKI